MRIVDSRVQRFIVKSITLKTERKDSRTELPATQDKGLALNRLINEAERLLYEYSFLYYRLWSVACACLVCCACSPILTSEVPWQYCLSYRMNVAGGLAWPTLWRDNPLQDLETGVGDTPVLFIR